MPSIQLNLTNVFGEPVRAKGTAALRNQSLSSRNQLFRVELDGQGTPVVLKDVPGAPNGLAQLDLAFSGYLFRKLFVNVPAGRDLVVDEQLFVDPKRTKATFPPFGKLPKDVLELLRRSGWKAAEWNAIEPEQKAGLMNICAKARTVFLASGETPLDHFEEIEEVLPARLFVHVSDELLKKVEEVPQLLAPKSGALHEFPEGYETVASFKTSDPAGNLQLTFGQDGNGATMVDADLDDHAGIRHWLDVFRHSLTGEDTHPYNIHQVLVAFQGLDPGYRLG